jgi:hypothetical protein
MLVILKARKPLISTTKGYLYPFGSIDKRYSK